MNIAALIIAASLLASRVLGVLREMLLARIAGVALEKNALDLAFMVPDILNHVVSTGFLSIVFIPIFTGYWVKGETDLAWRFFSNVLNVMGGVLLILTIPAFLFMPELILLFTAADPSPELLDRATYFGRIILPGQLFFLAGTFLVAVQHTRKQFLIPSLTGIVYNVSIVGGGWLLRSQGVVGFAWGVPVGAFIGFFVLQWVGAKRGGLHWQWLIDPRAKDFRRAISLMFPMMLGVGSMFALEFVIRSFGAGFGGHGISSLNYAYRLMYTLVAVFGFSVGVAGYPDMARLAKEGRSDEIGRKVWQSIARMFSILVPAIVVLGALAFPVVRLLFERGAFDRQATEGVSELLVWYLPVSIGLCGQAVLVRAFYAQERMWWPTLLNTGVFVLTLPLYSVFQSWLGIRSVPWVGSLGATLQIILLAFLWVRNNGAHGLSSAMKDIALALLALGLCVVGVYFWVEHMADWVRQAVSVHLILYSVVVALVMGFGALLIQILIGSASAKAIATEWWHRLTRRRLSNRV